MYLRYGTTTHEANDALVSISEETIRNDANQAYKRREIWNITGKLFGTQDQLKAAIDGLRQVYNQDGLDLIILHNDGTTASAHQLTSGGSIGGVRITRRPSFPDGQGAEYATYRTYTLTAECEYPVGSNELLISFEESLLFTGGGPVYLFLELLKGLPQKQLNKEATTYRVIQSGRAVGFRHTPFLPDPIWPFDVERAAQVEIFTPRRNGNDFEQFGIAWQYYFAGVLRPSGVPHLWP